MHNCLRILILFPIIVLTLLAPGSFNWCENSWFTLIIIYAIYFGIAIYVAFFKEIGDKVSKIEWLGAMFSLLLAFYPRTFFSKIAFLLACPSGSYWGDRSAGWANIFEYGLINFIEIQSEALMFSILMLLYFVFYGFTIYRRKSLRQTYKKNEGVSPSHLI